MKMTILGSGGCVPIPKPLCQCPICQEAREKGRPYSRTGPCAFINDLGLLIDTPPLVYDSINNSNLTQVDYLLYTHLDGDHLDGHGVLPFFCFDGAPSLDSATKTITFFAPSRIDERLGLISSQYGRTFDAYQKWKVLEKKPLAESIKLNGITITPIFVEQNPAYAYLYLFISPEGKRLLYAPCDTKPFPLFSPYVYDVDWLVTQPGFFETGLRDDFVYPPNDLIRTELYSFDETLDIARTIRAKQVAFVHLEEYWNRSFDDYKKLEKEHDNISFAYDGMEIDL